MKRIFAAIKITPDKRLTETFYQLKSNLKFDRINWVELPNLHITLKFFGETDDDAIPEIIYHLKDVASLNPPFDISLNGLGIFGSSYKPKVIWVGIDNSSSLIKLGTDVLDRMDNIGFEKDRQNFVPHLTLGRIKFTNDKKLFNETLERFKSQPFQTSKIDQMQLIESKLSSDGPLYTTLSSFEL